MDVLNLKEQSSERRALEVTTLLNVSKYHDGKSSEIICKHLSVHFRRGEEISLSKPWIKAKCIVRRT